MQSAVTDPTQSTNNTSDGGENLEPRPLPSTEFRENQPTEEQNLQGGASYEPRRRRRRGRRRGRRRRRSQQRARARARVREEAQRAMAEIPEDVGSASEDSDNEMSNLFRDGSDSARSRSLMRVRSLDNEDFLRRVIAGITPTVTPPHLQNFPCRVPNCDWIGPLVDAAQHARTAHNDAILRGPRQRLSIPLAFAAYTRYWRLVDAFEELFLVQFRRRAGSRRRLQAAVQLVGPASRAARFLYLFHMQMCGGLPAAIPQGTESREAQHYDLDMRKSELSDRGRDHVVTFRSTPLHPLIWEITVVDSQDQTDDITSTPQPTTNCSTPPILSITRISLVIGETSSTRVDLEPAMISLWSAYNFSHQDSSLENIPPCLPALHMEDNDIHESTSAPRVLDLTLSIQRIFSQKE